MRLGDLTDSRILYEKRLPWFGFLVISLTVLAFVVVASWAAVTIRPSVVHGAGSIESLNRTYVMSSVSGTILEVVTPSGSIVEQQETMITVDSVDLAMEQQTIDAQTEMLVSALRLQDRYTAALETRVNGFDKTVPDESQYYYQFETVRLQRVQLVVDPASMRAIGYSDVEIANAAKGNQLQVREIENTARSASAARAAEIRAQIEQLSIRSSALEVGGRGYNVVAAASGKLYLNPNLKPGTIITAGEPVGTIASEDAGQIVRVYVSVPDRQFVSVGDRVGVSVSGLSPLIYGQIDGVVTSIDNDVTTMTSGGTADAALRNDSVFGISVKLDQDFVEGRDGDRHEVGNGAAVQAEFVYDEMTYLEFLLELLGFA